MAKAFKENEMRHGKLVGSTRTPLSGGNSKITRSDTLSDYWFVESKLRGKFPFFEVFNELQSKVRSVNLRTGSNRTPLYIIESGEEKLAVMLFKEFSRIVNAPEPSPHEPVYGEVFLSDRFYIVHLYDKDYPGKTLFWETVEKAEAENKVPLVGMHVKGKQNDLVMMKLETLARHILAQEPVKTTTENFSEFAVH